MKSRNRVLVCLSFLAFTTTPAWTAELTVNCGGDYSTIQAAVNAASPYDTITVCPGTYDEDVLIQTEGLTIQSTEISEQGPNTDVRAFSIGFAPNNGPHGVTIKGFTVGGVFVSTCGDGNGVGIESSGDYNTIAHNYVYDCTIGIRVNQNNVGNNVHHNYVENTGTGIEIEGGNYGKEHNVHHNLVHNAGGEGCYYVWASDSQVHQNGAYGSCGNGGINALFSDGLHIHHNVICAGIAMFGADNAYLHHNSLTGTISNLNNGGTGNREKKNEEEISSCPFYD